MTMGQSGTLEAMYQISTITLPLPFRLGSVNCYLVETGTGFVLIDTGSANARAGLEAELASAGRRPGTLDLIILTHGDFDHMGNAAYLRETFGTRIAMHPDDAGMAERGDMFWNRSSGNKLLRILMPVFMRFPKSNRFTPDLYLEDGDDFSDVGLDAQALSLPGHSRGSIGILTAAGDLFCGDLLENPGTPATNSIMDDRLACQTSLEKLKKFDIQTVYPGHGQPFPMDDFHP
jgi:glyoxylase-like metal-dependent hydrolase (beta-lactamase superfamily II)